MGNEHIRNNVDIARLRLADCTWPEVDLPEDTKDVMGKFCVDVQFSKKTQR